MLGEPATKTIYTVSVTARLTRPYVWIPIIRCLVFARVSLMFPDDQVGQWTR